MAVKRFEDFLAWQRARLLTCEIYRASGAAPFAKDFDLVRQIRRAAVSIMSNIAEGFERKRQQEFHQFLFVSKSSCAEVRSLLYVALDANYVSAEQFEQLMDQAAEVGRLVGGLRAAVAEGRSSVAPVVAASLTQNPELRTQNSRSLSRG